MDYLILNAQVVNEGEIFESDVWIKGERIEKIGKDLQYIPAKRIINASGKLLLPGVIDDQVHFREPGLTHKGTIHSESRAAVAGGITSFMEMPNTYPPAFTQTLLQDKYSIAAKDSLANYSFYLGTSNDNFEEVMKTNLQKVCGLKIFMGSSTGNLLVDDPIVLEKVFSNFPGLIATHCEHEPTIRQNEAAFRAKYGDDPPIEYHPLIRNDEACYLSSSFAVALAKKNGTRLHVLHISTAKETGLFESGGDVARKKITAEACIHHLWFTDQDYKTLGTKIKWNPAIKSQTDRDAIWDALLNDRLDVVATDHAPHTLEEKSKPYFQAPSGGPLVQHSLVAMLEFYHQNKITLQKLVEKMCHSPARLFGIKERGFIREGFWADLVLVNPNQKWTVSRSNILAKCGWSPFEGHSFSSAIEWTFVSGIPAYSEGHLAEAVGKRLEFVPR
jgi:dihydroorotase